MQRFLRYFLSSLLAVLWVQSIFSYAYTPKYTDTQTASLLNERIDDIIAVDPSRAEAMYTQLQDLYANVDLSVVAPWKVRVLGEMIVHIESVYIQPAPRYDFLSDDSITKFVTRDVAYDYLQYLPDDLVILYPSETIQIAHSPNSYHTISATIAQPLQDLATAYTQRFGTPILVNSGWRSFESQRDDFSQQCRDAYVCAYPGYSEHQSGLAVDFGGMFGDQHAWMANNAHLYGFHQSYQKWFDIDHYHKEDWHWRYLGIELATQLYNEGETFTEWYEWENDINVLTSN